MKDALQGRFGQEAAIIEKPPPVGPRTIPEEAVVAVFDQQDAAAVGTGVPESVDALATVTGQAGVFQMPPGNREQVRLQGFGEGLNFHGGSFLIIS
jgi:hypothetical protein